MGKRFDRNLPYVGMSEESRLLLDRLVREDERELRELLRGAVAMIECAPCDAFQPEELDRMARQGQGRAGDTMIAWLRDMWRCHFSADVPAHQAACESCDWQTAILCTDEQAATCKARVDEARAIGPGGGLRVKSGKLRVKP